MPVWNRCVQNLNHIRPQKDTARGDKGRDCPGTILFGSDFQAGDYKRKLIG